MRFLSVSRWRCFLDRSIPLPCRRKTGRGYALPRPDYVRPDKPEDPALYREIFALESAKWSRADRLIRQVGDPMLMGHVLFQRYMHPTAYRAKWTELRDWLKNYADHPGAWRVYKLAQKRKPRGIAMPKRPPARIIIRTRPAVLRPCFKRGPNGAFGERSTA